MKKEIEENSSAAVAGYAPMTQDPMLKPQYPQNFEDYLDDKYEDTMDYDGFKYFMDSLCLPNDSLEEALLSICNENDDEDGIVLNKNGIEKKKPSKDLLNKVISAVSSVMHPRNGDTVNLRKTKKAIRIVLYVGLAFGWSFLSSVGGKGIIQKLLVIGAISGWATNNEIKKLEDAKAYAKDQIKFLNDKIENAQTPEEKYRAMEAKRSFESAYRDIIIKAKKDEQEKEKNGDE